MPDIQWLAMEYRCRLGTVTGEILEEVHVSDSEAHLRRELEQKGFCVLGMRPAGVLGRVSLPGHVRRKIPVRDFLVFNQELATLLKAGMPLVQSLDILRSRVDHPTFRPVLDEIHDSVRAGSSLSDAFAAHGDLRGNRNRTDRTDGDSQPETAPGSGRARRSRV